jgi:hypothetical protein
MGDSSEALDQRGVFRKFPDFPMQIATLRDVTRIAVCQPASNK